MTAPLYNQEIACQQVLEDDDSVFSIQWSDFPTILAKDLSPEALLERYLAYIRRCTATIIRPRNSPKGMEFRLLGTGTSLISFLPPAKESESVLLRIRGGLLVQPGRRNHGELRFSVVELPQGIRVSLQLSGYFPLILGGSSPSIFRRRLYSLTQAFIHRMVTVRFLALLYRELSGVRARVRVVTARVRDGRPV